MEELKVVDIYDYTFIKWTKKNPQVEKDKSVPERLKRLENNYLTHGMKRTVEAAIAVNIHGHPHIMLLRIGNSQKGFHKLPGGRCRRDETEEECLKRKLTKRLAPEDPNEIMPEWIVHGVVSVWYRPNFENSFYPYLPAHITKPKERKLIYLVTIPECTIAYPRNYDFIPMPFFDLYENSKKFGSIISSLPQVISKFEFNYIYKEK
ncbi:nudix motif 21-like protein [Naegleria gruberi]|uniref:Cleavage and polyadenylation specificity factor subunit 5 n=1 Tax=Naegleria gruberi TaxID=5762 RepID=D2VMA4_NAEGR|nr:nudix motif 21-like protein [Naegleria gruberi]EFC41954.1 nudix motif 21-like protein [Naegleria gruberi]|eukprot:XP_002674698.1 nudix motif 21-like protein [Naegleria gruberi strain NEG-M]